MARPVTERLRKTIETEVYRLLEEGVPEEEVLARISEKYGINSEVVKLNEETAEEKKGIRLVARGRALKKNPGWDTTAKGRGCSLEN